LYLDFWAKTGDPRYPGHKTLIVALEPSIERVARDVHLTGGRIGTQMLLWVPPQDLVVRPWGKASMVVTQNPAVVPTM
jgi:hypothetical protein